MNPETGEIEERLGPAEGIRGPDDLAFGPDGSLYWTDILIGDVGRRYPDGTTRVVASIGPGPNPITFSDEPMIEVLPPASSEAKEPIATCPTEFYESGRAAPPPRDNSVEARERPSRRGAPSGNLRFRRRSERA